MLEKEPETEGGLKRWLEGVGLGHYTDLVAQHRLDLDVMGDLTEPDLGELGLPLGDPPAQEDDAERSVRAGLEIVRVLSTARAIEPRGALSHAPAVRIGIATGLVVVGDLVGQGTEERDSAVGETVNLAARLQALAPPNGVVISTSTQSLL